MQIGPKYSNTHTHTHAHKVHAWLHSCVKSGCRDNFVKCKSLGDSHRQFEGTSTAPLCQQSSYLCHLASCDVVICNALLQIVTVSVTTNSAEAKECLIYSGRQCMYVCVYVVCVYCMLNVPTLLLLFLAAPSVVAQPFDGLTNSAAVGQFEGTVGRTSTFITQLCQFTIKSTNTFCIQLETVKTSLAINHSWQTVPGIRPGYSGVWYQSSEDAINM